MRTNWILTLCLSWFVAFALGNGLLAQNTQELTQPNVPLEQMLNRDGTLDLNKDFHGSLDPTGWQMTTGPNGEPRFVPVSAAQQTAGSAQIMALAGDENWDDEFGTQGLNGPVGGIAVSGSEVYVGGAFTVAGTVEANNIAKWDGASWSALGSGMNGQVLTIAISGGDVYAGGRFTTAGGVAANYIAKWDGVSWSALDDVIASGPYFGVFAMAANDREVYVGGKFTTVGDIAVNNIAKWNGKGWSAVGGGMNGDVHALAISGNTVYAGGDFSRAGGVAANRIAKWDGMNWSALGSGMDNTNVRTIAVSGSKVYAGGEFIRAGEVTANYIAAWDGTIWSAMAGGVESLEGYDQVMVFSLAVHGNDVYAGGLFIKAGGVVVNRIAKWDGTNWSALGSGVNSNEYFTNVFALAVGSGELYAGGTFTTAGGKPSLYFGRYSLNQPPIANAGADQTVIVNETVQLDGSGSNDPDGDPITYSWEITTKPAGSIATLSDPAIVNPTFVADMAGEYTVSLIVNDGTIYSAPDEVIITAITAQNAVQNLIDQINALVASGDLEPNQAKPLADKLTAIIALLDNDKTEVAINQLEAFINMVSADIKSGKLETEQGEALIDAANAIIAALNAGGALPKNAADDFVNRAENVPPSEFRLEQNAPNPFNPTTTISFALPEAQEVTLAIYSMQGQLVRTLLAREMSSGRHSVVWDARDEHGRQVASGMYVCVLKASAFIAQKKLLLMK